MKDQYFGDINDYRKYGLLRALQWSLGGRSLVAWMLTPDDETDDGGRRSYLQDPGSWERCDPELFAGLSELLRTASRPRVALLEGSVLLPCTTYYSQLVPDALWGREAWQRGLIAAISGIDLVFVDPDNGIEVSSVRVGQRASSKYVTWAEIECVWKAGCSVLIYQHFPHKPRESFTRHLVTELRQRTGAGYVEAFRTSHVLFLLAAQERHARRLREAQSLVSQRWQGQIVPMRLAGQAPLALDSGNG